MKKRLIYILFLLRLDSLAIKLFNSMAKKEASLRLLKSMIAIGKRKNSHTYVEKYSNLAIELYPKNSFGYIELAKLHLHLKRKDKAKIILESAPSTVDTKKMLEMIHEEEQDYEERFIDLDEHQLRNKMMEDPLNFEVHYALMKLYERVNDKLKLKNLLKSFPSVLNINLKILLKKSIMYQAAGDQVSSFNTLMVAQKRYPEERRVLFKLSEIYRYDKQEERAYTFLLAGELSYPKYGAIRRLSFEVDHGRLNAAEETLERILTFETKELVKFMSMINRVSTYFPNQVEALAETRKKISSALSYDIFKDDAHFNTYVKFALSNRWVKLAERLIEEAKQKEIVIDETVINWQEKIGSFIHIKKDVSLYGWLDIADNNEDKNMLIGFNNKLPLKIDQDLLGSKQIVELFIPNSFFTNPSTDKSSFGTINTLFKEIYLTLLEEDDLVIIPRHQYNWRFVTRHTEAKTISYHTFNTINNTDWLHIQESTLSGYCSVDSKGFAGYASITDGFEKIENALVDISSEEIKDNHTNLYSNFIENNVSKYEQDNSQFSSPKKYVFVALQVLTDIVADLAHIDGVDLVKTVANHYKDTDTTVVVKRHPYCNSISIQRTLDKLKKENLIEVSDASIHDIIKGAEAVFTVNSGVGLEALMHLKPVVVTGECDYKYAVHACAKNEKELIETMSNNDFFIDKNKILNFLYFYNTFYIHNEKSIKELLLKWLK